MYPLLVVMRVSPLKFQIKKKTLTNLLVKTSHHTHLYFGRMLFLILHNYVKALCQWTKWMYIREHDIAIRRSSKWVQPKKQSRIVQ